jgi:nitrile hydratase
MPVLTADQIAGLVATGGSTRVDADVAPRFAAGDNIIVRNINPTAHTRLPRYLRGHRGVIESDHGVFIFPDTHAAGKGAKPQHCYSVRFTAQEVFGREGGARDALYVDVFDDYMDPA